MEPTPLILTKYKSKLPSALSWPIGAEELSAALRHMPQFSDLRLDFYCNAGDRAIAQTIYWMTVMDIQYRKRAKGFSDSMSMIEAGILERHWEISVHPVLREHKKHVHDGIIQQLPRVADWIDERSRLDSNGYSKLLVVWNAQTDVFYVSTQEKLEPIRNLKDQPL